MSRKKNIKNQRKNTKKSSTLEKTHQKKENDKHPVCGEFKGKGKV
jgi:hypothetical protein